MVKGITHNICCQPKQHRLDLGLFSEAALASCLGKWGVIDFASLAVEIFARFFLNLFSSVTKLFLPQPMSFVALPSPIPTRGDERVVVWMLSCWTGSTHLQLFT